MPGEDPELLSVQELEESRAIRWVDINGEGLETGEALALLDPICRGELSTRIVRDLVSPKRFPAGVEYGERAAITAAYRVRHLQASDGSGASVRPGVTSLFDPLHLLTGRDWFLSCWLPTRAFRSAGSPADIVPPASEELYRGVAESWRSSDAQSASDLADLVRRELAVDSGYRNRTI